jgi:hypothetical protein
MENQSVLFNHLGCGGEGSEKNPRSLFVHLQTDDEYDAFGYYTGEKSEDDIVDYGEGFIGMAAHVSNMQALDRMIFEDCELSGDKVVAPHLNLKAYPFWFTPEHIAKEIGCNVRDAAKLLDCWVILDSTRQMVEAFTRWVRAKGVNKALPYFERLAMAVGEVESMDPDDAIADSEADDAPVDTYKYHAIGDYDKDEAAPWIEKQPPWYQIIIRNVQDCDSLERLAALGKEAYRKELTHGQAGVFWGEYNRRKASLEKGIRIGVAARGMLASIAKANGNLASLGAWLYRVQQGQIRVANPPEKREWIVIWKKYNERKEAHALV